MDNETASLLARASAKAEAHAGLSEALEYGTVRVMRINGTMTIFAEGFRVTCDVVGTVRCSGYVVSSTCRDLAYDIIRNR